MKKVIFGISVVIILLIAGGAFFAYRSVAHKRAAQREALKKQQAALEEVQITLIEGWTLDDIATYLASKNLFTTKEFMDAQKKFDTSEYSFEDPKLKNLEGFLFPDTYRVFKEDTAAAVIEKLVNTFEQRFTTATKNATKSGGQFIVPGYESLIIDGNKVPGLTAYQLVTLASIVEKETGRDVSKSGSDQKARLDEERRTVAGIFYNRLALGQALQSDATINYVTKKSDASASSEDLEINSPYNTYRNRGLPPGPIASPSLSSLLAVLNPIKTDYYYFLHKQPSGEVVYSKTFEEHVRNKEKYLK